MNPILTNLLDDTQRLVVLTGAGMSAESGVPTFRDKQTGLWEQYDPETLASIQGWRRDRDLVWAWYMWRMALIQDKAEPNAGHNAIADMAKMVHVEVFTQNTDNLHERAGSTDVVHFHGNIAQPYCEDCGRIHREPIVMPEIEQQRVAPPRCVQCAGYIRPGVVFFGEMLPDGCIDQAANAILNADLVLVVGTSAIVHPVASLPPFAIQNAIPTVEINPNPTAFSPQATLHWPVSAAVGLAEIADYLHARQA
ncbi:NAD-dependent deacylase [Stomatohabitans albus]|uniref:SIR2 family NAD-dependent protein deacylase n=1 Tax=Stomatohabitans albus TaxID=3110766 RepID=UPI00300D6993